MSGLRVGWHTDILSWTLQADDTLEAYARLSSEQFVLQWPSQKKISGRFCV
jgi:hypothetical protein